MGSSLFSFLACDRIEACNRPAEVFDYDMDLCNYDGSKNSKTNSLCKVEGNGKIQYTVRQAGELEH